MDFWYQLSISLSGLELVVCGGKPLEFTYEVNLF